MSKQSDSDAGTIQAVLERLEKFRLPRALAIEVRVDAGELLNDSDIQFLYQALAAKLVGLYDEITRKALENEQQRKPGR